MQMYTLVNLFALMGISMAIPSPELAPEVNDTELVTRDGETKNAFCSRQYAAAADIVEIYGGCGEQGWGLNGDNSGVSENTYNQFKGCGAVTGEKFEYYGDQGREQTINDNSNGAYKNTQFRPCWYYTFNLPIAVNDNCMGRAVKSSGGPAMKCQA